MFTLLFSSDTLCTTFSPFNMHMKVIRIEIPCVYIYWLNQFQTCMVIYILSRAELNWTSRYYEWDEQKISRISDYIMCCLVLN